MIRAKFIIIVALAICALTIGSAIIESVSTPDSGGLNLDSYGTEFYGMKGLFDTAQKLNLPIKRSLTPPEKNLAKAHTLLLYSTSPTLIRLEPEYIRDIADWVKEGGYLVIVPNRHIQDNSVNDNDVKNDDALDEDNVENDSEDDADDDSEVAEIKDNVKPTLTNLLGLKGIRTEFTSSNEPKAEKKNSNEYQPYQNKVKALGIQKTMYEKIITVNASWDNESTATTASAYKLALPHNFRSIILTPERQPLATLRINDSDNDSDGKNKILGAVFRHGNGTICYLSDPALFFNRFFFEADNAVLAINTLYPKNAPLLVDEFFHGLSITGNPFWIVTQKPYNYIIILTLVAIILWIVRNAVRLGPPVTLPKNTRRSLHEYIGAMSVIFARADATGYILNEAYTGILWRIRKKLNLPAHIHQVEQVAAAIARKEPDKAGRLLETSQKIQTLLKQRSINKKDALYLIQEINKCL